MHTSNRNYAATVPFVGALANLGLCHVAITPGSRNTPLAFAFADNAAIADTSHHDERSAAFFALGMAKATRTPVALVCTSGTAAAEYFPAIVEAKNSRTPLIVLTADRPPELRDVGAQQTIDQTGMYGRAVKWFNEAPVPEAVESMASIFAALAARAWSAAVDTPAGPVHVNMPFRDPMAPVVIPGDAPEMADPILPTFTPAPPLSPAPEVIDRLSEAIQEKRTLVVVGPHNDGLLAQAVASLGTTAGLPVYADPLSGLRAGHHDLTSIISTGDWLARRGDLDGELRPELIIRFGATPTSKSMASWMAANNDVEQVIVDEAGWRDPGASASSVVRANGAATARSLSERAGNDGGAWLKSWIDADQRVGDLFEVDFPSEPAVAQALRRGLPNSSTLYVSSSMPIRLMDAYFRAINKDVRILGNRGANGIDGLISSALGTAYGSSNPAYLFCGDVSLIHDIGALATVARMEVPLTIVLTNNDGGGIFHMLPQVEFPEHFERHLGTPHGLNFSKIAEAFEFEHQLPGSVDQLAAQIAAPATSPRILEVRTDRSESADLLRSMWKRVAEAK